ncbi:hypothetical protein [Leucobacter sp. M11]|uniref:hypothetical protein n=1 Tax=Leucobacter sp. M11 TaxID=2993565 RepID=UPI002D8057C8|nr:hypothetical protein [Leucobacter sp. M11]MEB4613355.1 hypothetical protein [Leucobacter sp. M11]
MYWGSAAAGTRPGDRAAHLQRGNPMLDLVTVLGILAVFVLVGLVARAVDRR